MTPAQKAGVVKGKRYIIGGDEDRKEYIGKIAVLDEDDNSSVPYFYIEGERREGRVCLDVKDLTLVATTEAVVPFSVNVGNGATAISLGVELTAEQVAAVLATAGVK